MSECLHCMKGFKKFSLPFVVFLTGACVLVIEVVATRILSPYFGNTIFTVSSVIGIVLAALSLGYYFGGKLADAYPAEKVFYSIILFSGLSVVLLHVLAMFLLPVIGYRLSIVSGPIISAIILFFCPSLILGTLSPFAIKLQEKNFPQKGIGSISGEMFFWSTLGSIFGSLFTGFVLIPQFGINQIVLSTAIVLILLGFIPLLIIGSKKFFFNLIIVGIIAMLSASIFFIDKPKNVVFSRDGVYEKMTIYDGEYAGHPTRFFKQDRSISGAMFLDSDELVFDYTKYYAVYRLFNPDIKQALVIGGGAYSIPKALLKDLPNATVDVSEIEPSLYELVQTHFNVKKSERLNNFTDDGRRLLHDTNKQYDLIFSDVYYSLFSIPFHFTTKEFFEIAKSKLGNNGVFVANLIGDLSRQKSSLIMSELKTFQAVFPNSYYFAVDSPGKIGSQNIIFVGYNSDQKIDLSDSNLSKNENPIIRSLAKKRINPDRFELSPYTTLTDNYAPIEYLTSRLLKNSFSSSRSIDGNELMAVIDQQLRYGPRYLSAEGHQQIQKMLTAEMDALADEVHVQTWKNTSADGKEQQLSNIIGRFNPSAEKRIVLGTHYDSKKFAELDKKNRDQAVLGANDSASGVAVLMELARILSNDKKTSDLGIDIVFFDGEEGEENLRGDYKDWKPLGSTYFADHLSDLYGEHKPVSGVVLDMVCDKNLKILKEPSSVKYAPDQVKAFWDMAKKIDRDVFSDKESVEIVDDHTPLNKAGIPTFLVIDFDYKSFHTGGDTLDKCSAKSLKTVAEAVVSYLSRD